MKVCVCGAVKWKTVWDERGREKRARPDCQCLKCYRWYDRYEMLALKDKEKKLDVRDMPRRRSRSNDSN
jgi:hypothetical protein